MQVRLYKEIAIRVQAYHNSLKANMYEWRDKHMDAVDKLVRQYMPSGSGFDNGTTLDWEKSTGEKLVFQTSYHHMNESGCYDGWTDHTVTILPSFIFTLTIKISGPNRNDIKDYMTQCFDESLNTLLEYHFGTDTYMKVSE